MKEKQLQAKKVSRSLILDLPTITLDDTSVQDFVPLTPGADINVDFSGTVLANSDFPMEVFHQDDATKERANEMKDLMKKVALLEKQNRILKKENEKMRKTTDEVNRLNRMHQQRNFACTCKNTSTPLEFRSSSSPPAAMNKPPAGSPETLDEINITPTQTALLLRHVEPQLKIGMLVGDLATMLFSVEELTMKTASALNGDKLLFMLGRSNVWEN